MNLFEEKDNNTIKKRSFVWNLIAAVINASEAVLVLALASRVVRLDEVGVLTYGFAFANLVLCIGKFGVRNYQASDILYERKFIDYFIFRLISVSVAIIISFFYLYCLCLLNTYDIKKAATIMIIVFIYQVEAIGDVFLGETQRKGRLDIGARFFSIRWCVTLVIWMMILICFRDIFISSLFALIGDLFLAFIFCGIYYKSLKSNEKTSFYNIKKVFFDCFPICISMFLSIFLSNFAKYVIEFLMEEDIQAIYGYISMPVFVLSVVSFIIIQPKLVDVSYDWNKEDYFEVGKTILKICFLLVLLSAVYTIIALFFGIPALSVIYGIDLTMYKQCFMILVIGSVALAFGGLFVSILTVMRRQFVFLFAYAFVSSLIVIITSIVRDKCGLEEITIINVLGIVCLTIIVGFFVALFMIKKLHYNKIIK